MKSSLVSHTFHYLSLYFRSSMISSRILLAGLFCLCPLSLAQKIEPDPKHTLIIISTSDIHGNLDKFPKLATLVKKYRSKLAKA